MQNPKAQGPYGATGQSLPSQQSLIDTSQRSKYPDLWASILFGVNFLAFIILSIMGIQFLNANATPSGSSSSPSTVPSNKDPTWAPLTSKQESAMITIFVLATLFAAFLSGLYLNMMQRHVPVELILGPIND